MNRLVEAVLRPPEVVDGRVAQRRAQHGRRRRRVVERPRDVGRVRQVALREELHVEAARVRPQLLHGARAEGVAGRDHHVDAVLLEVVGDLGERGRLADAVDAHEDDGVGAAALGLLRLRCVACTACVACVA